MNTKAIVLLSGGQDSVTTLANAIKTHGAKSIVALSFNYNQRHSSELSYAIEVAETWGVQHHIVTLGNILPSSALTNLSKEVKAEGGINNLPTTFVPGRNLLFLSIAASHACAFNAQEIHIGVSQTDYSGYPDCRLEFIQSLEQTLKLAMPLRDGFKIVTPLIHLSKAQTFALADELGVLDTIIEGTLTCYKGVEYLNEWGRGCGECPACVLRKQGYTAYRDNLHA